VGTRRFGLALALSTVVGAIGICSVPAVADDPVVRTTGGVIPADPSREIGQSATWIRAKQAGLVGRNARGRAVVRSAATGGSASGAPSSLQLYAKYTSHFVEPLGDDSDDGTPRKSYHDRNYWNLCVPGASIVSAYYWTGVPLWLEGTFHEPYGPFGITTHWEASDTDAAAGFQTYGRGYLMYMAMDVQPPNWKRAGIDDFDTYPTGGGSLQSMRDALNWEISSHGRIGSGPWSSYFYAVQGNDGSRFTAAHLNADVITDLYGSGVPVNVAVDADYLPNWPDLAKPLHHAITVIGYDKDAGTYTYVDTCGKACGSFTNGGLHVISQAQMFKAIRMVGKVDDNGSLIANPDGSPKYPFGGYIW